MKKIINGKWYDTEIAEFVASNEFRDGENRRNTGRITYLYKTKKKDGVQFFAVYETIWLGEHDEIELLTISQAKKYFERLTRNRDFYEEILGKTPEEV